MYVLMFLLCLSGSVPSQVRSLVESEQLVSLKLTSAVSQECKTFFDLSFCFGLQPFLPLSALQVLAQVADYVLCSDSFKLKEPLQRYTY